MSEIKSITATMSHAEVQGMIQYMNDLIVAKDQRIAELEAELEIAKEALSETIEDCKLLEKAARETGTRISILREALRKYGEHLPGCQPQKADLKQCLCGLDEALADGGEDAPSNT